MNRSATRPSDDPDVQPDPFPPSRRFNVAPSSPVGDESPGQVRQNVVGLRACRDAAIKYSAQVGEDWNERAYVCVLKKDGVPVEKHRAM
jgi:hypothetical protein